MSIARNTISSASAHSGDEIRENFIDEIRRIDSNLKRSDISSSSTHKGNALTYLIETLNPTLGAGAKLIQYKTRRDGYVDYFQGFGTSISATGNVELYVGSDLVRTLTIDTNGVSVEKNINKSYVAGTIISIRNPAASPTLNADVSFVIGIKEVFSS